MLILVVLSAITLIWVFIKPILSVQTENIKAVDLTTSFDIPKSSVLVSSEEKKISFLIKRTAGDTPIKGIFVVLFDKDGKTCTKKFVSGSDSIKFLESKIYSINMKGSSSADCSDMKEEDVVSISISAIIDSDGKEIISKLSTKQDVPQQTGGGGGQPPVRTYCGDGSIQTPNSDGNNEECDGQDLGGKSCQTLGHLGGQLSCKSDCTFNRDKCYDLIAYYRMDETSWSGVAGEVRDSAGNNHGTANNGAMTSPNSMFARAGYFDGVNDYVVVNNIGDTIKAQQYFTISFWMRNKYETYSWVNPLSFGNSKFRFETGNPNTNLHIFDYISFSSIDVCTGCITPETWNHIVFVRDGGIWRTYVNSVETKTGSFSGEANMGPHLFMGMRSASLNGRYNGSVDEVKIFNGALSASEILNLYNNPPQYLLSSEFNLPSDLVARYKMDEPSWSGVAGEVRDSSGNNFHGTSNNGAQTRHNGAINRSGFFDGDDDSITTPAFSVPLTSGKTTCTWVYFVKLPDSYNIMSLVRKASGFMASVPSIRIVGDRFNDRAVNSSGADSSGYASNFVITTNRWIHVCNVWYAPSPGNNISMQWWINGTLDSDIVTNIKSADGFVGRSVSDVLALGKDEVAGRNLNGSLDEVIIFNRRLTQQEINQIYNHLYYPA